MRIMGIDLGTKRVGIAVSDEMAMIAQGREVVLRKTDVYLIKRIKELVDEYKVVKIIVGHPIHMNGTVGERALDSEEFSRKLSEAVEVEIKLWDERLSTKEAEDVMILADISRAKRKKVIDKMAAQIILQGYLDSL